MIITTIVNCIATVVIVAFTAVAVSDIGAYCSLSIFTGSLLQDSRMLLLTGQGA